MATIPAGGFFDLAPLHLLTTGTLRLRREGSTFTGYYLAGDDTWVPIGSGIGPTDDASFSLKVTCIETEFPVSKAAFMYSEPFAWMFPWGYPD